MDQALTRIDSATFDYTGQVDYLDAFDTLDHAFVDVTVRAGVRVGRRQVDLSARAAYGLVGANPKTPHEKAVEYFLWDWEYSQSPEVRTH
jgi:polyamine oxidase